MQVDAVVRTAQPTDIPAMLEMAEKKRRQYETYQPVFWRIASDAREKQQPYFEKLLARENLIALVYEAEEHIQGFIIAMLIPAPPVYNPGGPTCSIDDFYADDTQWQTIGQTLLMEVMQTARQRGAAQAVVVCGHLDQPKREMLAQLGFSIATEWYVHSLK